MKNIERLARHIAENGTEGILIHTIPGTSNWIIAQKLEPDKWLITLGNPSGNILYNIGTISDAQHLNLWQTLTKADIEKRLSQALIAKELRERMHNFLKKETYRYQKFIKNKAIKKKKTTKK